MSEEKRAYGTVSDDIKKEIHQLHYADGKKYEEVAQEINKKHGLTISASLCSYHGITYQRAIEGKTTSAKEPADDLPAKPKRKYTRRARVAGESKTKKAGILPKAGKRKYTRRADQEKTAPAEKTHGGGAA